ncbi:MAG: polysaccharide deacetylase [Sphingomonas sp.]
MATRVLFTIDTELTWRHYVAGSGWRKNLADSYDPAGVGVPYQLEQLARYGLKACFFVDPMPALVYGLDPIRRMVEPIIAAGQEVQLHLHSFWRDLAAGRRSDLRFELTQFSAPEQRELIEAARDLLIAAGAPVPIAFRAGSYAANADTLKALASLGIRYDASHNGAEHPGVSALPLAAELLDPSPCAGVTEIPVTQIRRPDGGLRPLQICALSFAEMRAALLHAGWNRHAVATIVCHSFELATRDGKRINRLVRGRFDRLCAFLADQRVMLPTATFDNFDPPARSLAARPLPSHRLRAYHRMAEQAWSAGRYERPLTGAAIVSMPPVAALEEILVLAGL